MTNRNNYNWLPDFVYGGIDGAVTTFAVVAGVEGAALSLGVILILGFSNVFADGFSMATGKYLSDKAEMEQFNRIRKQELELLSQFPEQTKHKLSKIFQGFGFNEQQIEDKWRELSIKEDELISIILKNDHEISIENLQPLRGAVSTFISFILIGFIPLAGYTTQAIFQLNPEYIFLITCFSTLIALFIVGAVKSRFSEMSWFLSGLQTSFLGGIAAAISYLVGVLLQGLA